MSCQRKPKRQHPEHMCYQCREWDFAKLDWGECDLIANYVAGDQYTHVYAYDECWFENDQWKEKKEP